MNFVNIDDCLCKHEFDLIMAGCRDAFRAYRRVSMPDQCTVHGYCPTIKLWKSISSECPSVPTTPTSYAGALI